MRESYSVLSFAEEECVASLMGASDRQLEFTYGQLKTNPEFEKMEYMLFTRHGYTVFVKRDYFMNSLVSEMVFRGIGV